MKKIILILLFAISLPLYSEVVFDSSFDSSVMAVISNAVDKNDKGNDDVTFSFSSFEKNKWDDGSVHISFDLSFLDENLDVNVVADEKNWEKSIAKEIHNVLFYQTKLYSDSAEIIDYIYSDSFSFIPKHSYRRGTTLTSYDESGNVSGVFEVRKHYKDVDGLQAIYIKDARPGNRLEKSSSFRYSLMGATNFYIGAFSFSAELMNTSWIYPFSPTLSVFYEERAGKRALYAGIGVTAFLDLNDIFSSGFTLVQDGRVGASASLLLGGRNGEFAYDGYYGIFYEHRLFPKFYWRIGYAYYPMMKSSLILGIGGSF